MLAVAELEQLPVAEARAGVREAWDTLFRRYQLPLFVYVQELVHNEQLALDIIQEVFVSAVRHLSGLRDDDRFGSWLFGIAHQKCIQQWRRGSRERAAFEEFSEAPESEIQAPDKVLIKKEQEAELLRLIDQLPAPQRSTLLLYFIEDFSMEEIAQITGAQIGTVKSRLHYAKKTLGHLLTQNS
jgi:RNA polymerase sigma-70 factor (ECF subfamily)